jgi:hypothetical protein
MNASTTAMTPLPLYQSHKKVLALKIKKVIPVSSIDAGKIPEAGPEWTAIAQGIGVAEFGSGVLVLENGSFFPRNVTKEYMEKHKPEAGGYWVQYEDGYESWCPAAVFEAENTRVGATREPHTHGKHSSTSQAQIEDWFKSHTASLDQLDDMHAVRTAARIFAETINSRVPRGPDKSAAFRLIREAMMTANAGIMIPSFTTEGATSIARLEKLMDDGINFNLAPNGDVQIENKE